MTGRLPTFLVIGAPKCGTTSLFEYLRAQPDIYMPSRKEVNFFIKADCLEHVDAYEREFGDAGSARVVGEASPRYTMCPRFDGVPARIAAVIPDVRLVYLVRHPIERMQSHWLHNLVLRGDLPPVERALVEEHMFLDTSRYVFQIERYLEHFTREQLLVLTTDALRDRRDETIRRVLRFIGASEDVVPLNEDAEFNRTATMRLRRSFVRPRNPVYRAIAEHLPRGVKRVLDPVVRRPTRADDGHISDALRRSLEGRLAEDVRGLRAYLGEDFDGWGIA